MDIDLVRAQLLLFAPNSPTNSLSSLSLLTPPPIPTSNAIQLRLTAENPENGFSLAPGIIRAHEIQWPAGRGVRIDTWLSFSSSQSIPEWVIGTDFDSLIAKVIVRGSSFEESTEKAKRALREFKLAKNCKVKTNITVLAGVLEHQDWEDRTVDTLWLERNLDGVLGLGKAIIENRNSMGITELAHHLAQRKSDNASAGGSPPASGSTLLQPGTLFHLTLSSASPSDPAFQETMKHTLTLNSIANNAFPEKLSGVLQSTFSPSPLAFSLSQSTSATIGNGEGFELANPNDIQHVAAPLTGKIVDVHPSLKLAVSTSQQANEGERKVRKGETLVVMSVMKMESVVVAPHDGIVERAGRGVKIGSILGESMLVCVVRPIEKSRL